MEATMLEGIKANGCAVEENPDIASFQEATADLYLKEEVKALVNPELVEGVRAAVEEFKTK